MLWSFACANAANDAVKLLRTSLRGELRLAPHAPSPGWHGSLTVVIIIVIIIIIIIIIIIVIIISIDVIIIISDATFR